MRWSEHEPSLPTWKAGCTVGEDLPISYDVCIPGTSGHFSRVPLGAVIPADETKGPHRVLGQSWCRVGEIGLSVRALGLGQVMTTNPQLGRRLVVMGDRGKDAGAVELNTGQSSLVHEPGSGSILDRRTRPIKTASERSWKKC